jgi:phosphoserine phosphatase
MSNESNSLRSLFHPRRLQRSATRSGPLACLALVWSATALAAAEPILPSWNESPAKTAIVNFVARVTDARGPQFVPPPERIAVFDHDGTLWCEQPAYPQFQFGLDRMKTVAAKFPQLRNREPFRSALAGDLEGVTRSGVRGLIELTAATHGGLSAEEFAGVVSGWLATARHPRFQQPYTNCVYQPMRELLAHLRAHGFQTWIVSGGEAEFLRPWAEQVYGVPPAQIIGSAVKTKLETRSGSPVVVRQPEIETISDGPGKPLAMQRVIGRRPIAAFGNSDGDLPMLQWTAAGAGARLCVYVHHTDGEREYAYDRNALTGRLDKGLDEARTRNWTVVDMKRDWKRVFPFTQP